MRPDIGTPTLMLTTTTTTRTQHPLKPCCEGWGGVTSPVVDATSHVLLFLGLARKRYKFSFCGNDALATT